MNLVIIGASGFIGSAITQTALARGHQVRAIVRDTTRLEALAQQYPQQLVQQSLNVLQTADLADAIADADAVISAFSGHAAADISAAYQQGFESILTAVKQTKRRLLLVGGAASLKLPDDSLLLHSPHFPEQYRASALGAYAALQQLQAQTDVQWSYLSPAAEIFSGDSHGPLRLGGDYLVMDAAGQSRISTHDYATVMLNEVEQPQHRQQRFTAAY